MKPVFLYSDIFFFAFIFLIISFVLWARRKEYYRDAFRRIFTNRRAIVCFTIIVLYGGVAFLDSIHFKPKDGDVQSFFDVVFAKMYNGIDRKDGKVIINVETSYSKPLEKISFDKKQNKKTGDWEYTPGEARKTSFRNR